MTSRLTLKRITAIESGVRNAVDTVVVDRAISAEAAYQQLKGFLQDSLSSAKLSDIVTVNDMALAQKLWPL